jgi:histidine kinase
VSGPRRPWRQLRWRIVAAQMLVVVVGVVTLILSAALIASRSIDPALLASFRVTLNQALLFAASAATLAGLLASLLLMREILRPLHQLARSSRRIADGHYGERVAVPASDELAEVAGSFNQMAEALEQVEQQRIALIGNVAHELRTPLAGLEGYLEGLVDGVLPQDVETFDAMQHELRRLRRLVDDLQTLSRVEAGQVPQCIEAVDLAAIARRVVAQLQAQAGERKLRLAGTPGDGEILVRADADRAAQVLINLIGNAIQYTPEDGRVTVRLLTGPGRALVQVEDTGVGIPPQALPYLFERFYRVDPSRARGSGGSGIGLTIARHLAWAMGGDITAASPGLGQGSTFTLSLPLVEQGP